MVEGTSRRCKFELGSVVKSCSYRTGLASVWDDFVHVPVWLVGQPGRFGITCFVQILDFHAVWEGVRWVLIDRS